ncbi:hypothetical protein DAEQUDRAFT_807074 [Daedalea quercina L-15889]|uniref:Uncharacterized protein n=1 Tax=Daedalea quercina L-15889 TaxID=1314783 RepID=A0A165UDA1_9APHY|nr:hypothetical protein DAEQUDRAFT_807074 [Daedalea quercina L-15889]
MNPGGRHSRRRRSQSASSPVRALFPSDDPKWRISTKRARPNHPRSPSYKDLIALGEPPEKWDVDQWRRGKRVRRDTPPKRRTNDPHTSPCLFPFAHLPEDSARPAPLPGLPCTPAAFDLFPEHRRKKTRRDSRRSSPPHHDVFMPQAEPLSFGELNQLRSRALSELHRSVEESSEGQVQRLRDLENARSRPLFNAWDRDEVRHRRTRPDSSAQPDAASDGEDDIEIVSSEPASGSAPFHSRSPACKKRAMSLNMMDIDILDIEGHSYSSAELSERCSSPFSAVIGPSAYSSDDDMSRRDGGPMRYSGTYAIPDLTRSYTASSNPSCVSLSPVDLPTLGRMDVPISASPPEKAIAVLALAMANGACSVQDYSAIQQAEGGLRSPIDDSQVGDLWH